MIRHLVMLALVCAGCSGGTHARSSAQAVCVPGTVYSCVRGICSGTRYCLDDGSAFSSCQCASEDAGTRPSDAAPSAGAVAHQPAPSAWRAPATAAPDAGRPMDPPPLPDAGRARMTAAEDAGPAPERCERCVASAPHGWLGPVVLRSDAAAMSCKASERTAFEAGAEPQGAPATCSACTCQGGCAGYLDFETSDAAQCGGTRCTTSVSAGCVEISPSCLRSVATASLQPVLPSTSGCVASEQRASLPPLSWKTRVVACQPPPRQGGGCSAAEHCLPEAAYCVWRDGDQPCPAGTFSERSLYHRDAMDGRGCSACSCAAPSCSYGWRVFTPQDTGCGTPLLQLTGAGQCAQVNPVAGKLRVGVSISGDAPCSPAGGQSRGAVTASAPVTVCCEPR